jgi:hypothetical protein
VTWATNTIQKNRKTLLQTIIQGEEPITLRTWCAAPRPIPVRIYRLGDEALTRRHNDHSGPEIFVAAILFLEKARFNK